MDEDAVLWKILASPQLGKWQQVEIEFNDTNVIRDGCSTTLDDACIEDNLTFRFSAPLQFFGLTHSAKSAQPSEVI